MPGTICPKGTNLYTILRPENMTISIRPLAMASIFRFPNGHPDRMMVHE